MCSGFLLVNVCALARDLEACASSVFETGGLKLSSYAQDSQHSYFGCSKTTTKTMYLL